jgi:electron transfer flavoprotein-quinone oxidoreductase
MEEEEKFDVIIVGAGPAGSACAYVLAKAGKNVLVIERGDAAGTKNVSGGRLYTYALELVEPGLCNEAMLERKVVREQIMLLTEKTGITIDCFDAGANLAGGEAQSYTVLRASFDEWFAGKAEEQGAMIATGILVDDLIIEAGKVIGVRAGGDDMYADMVIAADGVNSFIAQKAGLKNEWTDHEIGVGVKEIIELPESVIEDRFQLGQGEGAARMLLGNTNGVQGGGFLYTNKNSISLGLVLSPASLAQQERSIADIYQEFKMHPAIYRAIQGGTTVEYGGHMVPENGWNSVPEKIYRDGLLVVGDAAGLVINTGTIIRGIDLAIVSGVAAARAVLAENAASKIGPEYVNELEKLHVTATMKLFAGWPKITGIERMAAIYPEMANEMMQFMFKVDGTVPEKMPKAMQHIMKKYVSVGQILSDAWKGFRAV